MAQKKIKTNSFTHHQQSKSEEIDITQPGVVHIDDEPYFVDGVVAKFILELLDEVDIYKQQLEDMERFTGHFGEG